MGIRITSSPNMAAAKPTAFRRPYDAEEGYYITHPNGQTSHYYLDTFTDPWLPKSQKPVILLNHGCSRTASMWYHWVPRLARDFVVIRRDARGHGKSSYPKRISPWSEQEENLYDGGYNFDMDTVIEEMVDFLDQLGIDRVIFFGEATSGEVGHALAAKHPERVRALITCSSPTMLPPQAVHMLSVGQSSWPEAVIKLGVRGWNEALAKIPGTLPSQDPALKAWLVDQASTTHDEGLAAYVIFLTFANSRRYLKDIRCPYMILAPTKSAAVPLSESRWISEQVPHAKLVEVESPGHEIFIEAADRCIDETLKFLKEIDVKSL